MRAFGIVMALFGCGIAFFGLVLISDTKNVNRISCSPSGTTTSPETTCFFDGDPNEGLRQSSGGLAVAVVGAGFIAGGLACAGAGGSGRRTSTSFAPPVGGAPVYATGPGQPGPGTYGQQQSPPPPPQYGTPQ